MRPDTQQRSKRDNWCKYTTRTHEHDSAEMAMNHKLLISVETSTFSSKIGYLEEPLKEWKQSSNGFDDAF